MGKSRLLGVFSPVEKRKLIDTLCGPNPTPEERDDMLRRCAHFARKNAERQEGYARVQRHDHVTARKIEKLAKKIVEAAGDDMAWRFFVEPVRTFCNIDLRTRGAPRKLTPPEGAADLLGRYQLAEQWRGRNVLNATWTVPRSRKGPFADVLCIVYRIKDPMPILEQIAPKTRPRGPITHMYGGRWPRPDVLFEKVVKSRRQ